MSTPMDIISPEGEGRGDRCSDWIISSTSNWHIATDTSWFTTFCKFGDDLKTFVYDYNFGRHECLGCGSIDLDTDRTGLYVNPRPFEPVPKKLHLIHALYVPTAVCNVLSQQKFEDEGVLSMGYPLLESKITKTVIKHDKSGSEIGYFVNRTPPGFDFLKLAGSPWGVEANFDQRRTPPLITYYWPFSETGKFTGILKKAIPESAASLVLGERSSN
ncbi:hypothetical protein B0T16DRAFT_450835 [Cercophora newfieldiana]|uniref:Uncharacterized protein n=1 Tax=Cercophora newfieldiana TaxID=92897 RepID=A0AA39YPY3_9PEZI|nr:hypothetical protein B0T16DRAFT_450835 [Cercophora newfieldiana]